MNTRLWRDLGLQIVSSLTAGGIVYLIALPQLREVLGTNISLSTTVGVITLLLAIIVSLLVMLVLALMQLSRRARASHGREHIQARNLSTLRSAYAHNPTGTFWSTRVTFWRIDERSPSRQAFRAFISEAIFAGAPVRRLWHLRSEHDLQRMLMYLEQYKAAENYHLKAIVAHELVIPDIAGIEDEIAVLALPSSANPGSIVNSICFSGKAEIRAIREYYAALWEQALPIKIGERLFQTNIDALTAQLRERPETRDADAEVVA